MAVTETDVAQEILSSLKETGMPSYPEGQSRATVHLTDSPVTPAPLEEPQILVHGQPLPQLPKDLYIPPDALEVFLEAFQGPLDLLLYLIRKQNIAITEIPIAEITVQYMHYVELMREWHLNLAADYLVMAATLAEIKSRSLLPITPALEEEGDDPRVQLIRRLQAYEQAKQAATELDFMPRLEREHWLLAVPVDSAVLTKPEPTAELPDLLQAFQALLQRLNRQQAHQITKESLTVRERMRDILTRLSTQDFCTFEGLIDWAEGRRGLVVSFIAVLELLKQSMITAVQTDLFAPLYLKAVTDATG